MNTGPKLRDDLVLVEQTYRGEQSFIVKDPETRKYYRFRPLEVRVMQALDGQHTPAAAADLLRANGVPVSAAAVEKFAAKLTGMGLCQRTLAEQSVLLMERLRAERRRRLSPRVFQGDIFRLRWSVGDPDELLNRWLPRLRFCFSRTFLGLSVALFLIYFLIIGLQWSEFSSALANLYTLRVGLGDLVVLWITGTVIIAIHELGHGFTCKYFGGEVHEIGAMLIYFEPAFFCNVNDAWTFPELRARLWVTAAGSWIQLVLASIAAIVWWAANPGTLISQVAFAAVLIGGLTTVLMNLNPLIPLDGYYALSDYLEVANLRQRAARHLSWLIKTRVFRLDLPEPPADERERRIFLIYGALAAGYITLILAFCAVNTYGWLSRTLGSIGTLIFAGIVLLAVRRQLRAGKDSLTAVFHKVTARLKSARVRSRLFAGAAVMLILGALVPWPITVSGPFTVWSGASLPLTAPDSGMVGQVNVREGSWVETGSPLLRLRSFGLEREAIVLRRTVDSLSLAIARARAADRSSDVAQMEALLSVDAARLTGLDDQIRAFSIRAVSSGRVLTPRPEELAGREVSRGQVLLRLGRSDSLEVRIALRGAGASSVVSGQPVSLLPNTEAAQALTSRIVQVSTTAEPSHSLEGRVRLAASNPWRPGMSGQARVTLRQSNLWGALWWSIRREIRSDILL
jgi:putative peptide zinc metalloprotease protein